LSDRFEKKLVSFPIDLCDNAIFTLYNPAITKKATPERNGGIINLGAFTPPRYIIAIPIITRSIIKIFSIVVNLHIIL